MDKDIEGALPHAVALSWGLVKHAQRGPKREMSLGQIVDAAISIADKEGLSAVSMSKIATSLGFTTMALYRYVPSKEDLILLMQDAAVDISIPEEDSAYWRDNMRLFVKSIMRIYQDHQWFCDIPASGIPITPNHLHIVDWALRIMKDLPLDHREKISIVVLLTGYVRVHSLYGRDMERAAQTGDQSEDVPEFNYSTTLEHLVTSERFPYLRPVVLAGAYSAEDYDGDDYPNGFEFEFGLARILDGIEWYISSRGEYTERSESSF